MPRKQHYVFAHRALPQLLHADPQGWMEVLLGPRASEFVHDLWDKVGEQCEPAERIPPDGLELDQRLMDDGSTLALILMPPPEDVTEVFFAAVALDGDKLRYFTLERGLDLDGENEIRFLCEWDREGRHLNFGNVTATTLDSFAAAVGRQLGREDEAEV